MRTVEARNLKFEMQIGHEGFIHEKMQISSERWRSSRVTFNYFLPRCMECRHGLAMRILSVCLSVTCVNCDKAVKRSVHIYIPYERSFSLVF